MGLLYDVTYYSKQTRARKIDFDRDTPAAAVRAPAGHLAHAVCTNGERDDFWADEKGDVVPTPEWYGKQTDRCSRCNVPVNVLGRDAFGELHPGKACKTSS